MLINKFTKTSGLKLGMLFAAAAFLCFYFFFNPSDSPFMPQCIFYHVTGLKCMGCGSQRVLHAVLHGDFLTAFRENAFITLSLPFLIFGVWLEFKRKNYPLLYSRVFSKPTIWTTAALLGIWFILRNIIGC